MGSFTCGEMPQQREEVHVNFNIALILICVGRGLTGRVPATTQPRGEKGPKCDDTRGSCGRGGGASGLGKGHARRLHAYCYQQMIFMVSFGSVLISASSCSRVRYR